MQNSPTFSQNNISGEEIITQHASVIKNEYNICIQDENMCLPYIYWLPKFHKEIVGFRFITAGTKCTSKNLSVKLSAALRSCMKVVHQRSKYNNFYTDMNITMSLRKHKQLASFSKAITFVVIEKKCLRMISKPFIPTFLTSN